MRLRDKEMRQTPPVTTVRREQALELRQPKRFYAPQITNQALVRPIKTTLPTLPLPLALRHPPSPLCPPPPLTVCFDDHCLGFYVPSVKKTAHDNLLAILDVPLHGDALSDDHSSRGGRGGHGFRCGGAGSGVGWAGGGEGGGGEGGSWLAEGRFVLRKLQELVPLGASLYFSVCRKLKIPFRLVVFA